MLIRLRLAALHFRTAPTAHAWRIAATRHVTTVAPVTSFSAAEVAKWSPDELVENIKALPDMNDVDAELFREFSGRVFLGLNADEMKEMGVSVRARKVLLPFLARITNKTVRIRLDPEKEPVLFNFASPANLREFLAEQGAACLRNGDNLAVRAGEFDNLKSDGLYTLDYSKPGIKPTVEALRDFHESTMKLVAEQVSDVAWLLSEHDDE